jgi:hypothetical protein
MFLCVVVVWSLVDKVISWASLFCAEFNLKIPYFKGVKIAMCLLFKKL